MFDEFEKYAEKTFVGFCTEPEIKYSEKGGALCKFSIPLNDKHKDEKPLWLNCKAWNGTAEAFAEICKKGCKVKVNGRFYRYEYNSNIYTEFYVRDFLKLADLKPKEERL